MHKSQTYLKVWSFTIPTCFGMFVSSSGSSYTKFKTCYNKINDTCNIIHYTKVQFCSRLHCWMDMMWDTKPLHPLSLTLLTLWCRLDHDSIFQLWVLCHEQGHPTLHFQDRRAVGTAMHRRISVWYWNSVVSQWSGYEWTERLKNGWTSI